MALIKCPECGIEVSDKAQSCPKCGYPIIKQISIIESQLISKRKCPYCGSTSVGKVRGLQGGEVFIAIMLFFLFIIPGIIYYIYMESVPYCSGCGRRV